MANVHGIIGFFCIFSSLFCNGNSANILGIMGCTSHSHHIWNEVIVNALAERGHNLTVSSVDENKSPKPNVTYIYLEDAYRMVFEHYKNADADFNSSGLFANYRLLQSFKMLECKGIFQSLGYQEAANLKTKFDLILFDMSAGPCVYMLMQNYPDIPVIGVSPFKMDPYILEILGGHTHPGYIPFFLDHQDVPMNFWNRITNVATYTFACFYRKFVLETIIDQMTTHYFPGPRPTLQEFFKRVKIGLINTHPAMDYAQPLPPNVIEIGGLHIKEPQKLPEDINNFIESAINGAILVSLGSNTKIETLGKQRIQALFNVIQKLPKYNFLWKIEKEDIFEDVPKNLLIRKWLPQNDILAHPKTKVFFTHAGGLSMQEATWHGVPVIAMPLFLDQFTNAHSAGLKGCAYEVNFKELNERSLMAGFSKVLYDKSYSSNMRKLQQKFRDRQNKPLDTAVWWIEYFLRNPEADHLSPSSRDMLYLVANSLDVYIIAFLISVVFVVTTWISFCYIIQIICNFKEKNSWRKNLKEKTL